MASVNPFPNAHYFTRITDTDHAGWLWICGLITLSYPLLSTAVRLFVRQGVYEIDDWTIGGATVSLWPM